MEKRTTVKFMVEVNVNEVVFDAYNDAKKHRQDVLKESYERALLVRPDLPEQSLVENELFIFWGAEGQPSGGWEVRSQRGGAVQCVLDLNEYTIVCNILIQGPDTRMMGWYIHRKPQGK